MPIVELFRGGILLGRIEHTEDDFPWHIGAFTAAPESANVWDSLGEACMAKGDRGRAIASYEKSLMLDKNNDNAVQRLERLRRPDRR